MHLCCYCLRLLVGLFTCLFVWVCCLWGLGFVVVGCCSGSVGSYVFCCLCCLGWLCLVFAGGFCFCFRLRLFCLFVLDVWLAFRACVTVCRLCLINCLLSGLNNSVVIVL